MEWINIIHSKNNNPGKESLFDIASKSKQNKLFVANDINIFQIKSLFDLIILNSSLNKKKKSKKTYSILNKQYLHQIKTKTHKKFNLLSQRRGRKRKIQIIRHRHVQGAGKNFSTEIERRGEVTSWHPTIQFIENVKNSRGI